VWGSQYERVTMGSVSLRTLETLSEATGNYRVEPSCTDTGSWLIALDGKVGSLESPRSKGLEDLGIACHRHARTPAVATARKHSE
jgi:hypothetical protein